MAAVRTRPLIVIMCATLALCLSALVVGSPAWSGKSQSSLSTPQGIVSTVIGGSAVAVGQSGGTLGFFGITPASRASAITQTYSTTSATVAADTSHAITDSTGGSVSTSALAALSGVDGTGSNAAPLAGVKNSISTLAAELALTKADALNTKKNLNLLIDQLQAYGLCQ